MKNNLHRQSDRAFGYIFAGLFLFMTLSGWWFFDVVPLWSIVCSALFATAATIKPGMLMPLNRLWEVIALKIACFTNAIVLGISFYLVVTPMGIFMRLLGRDPLHRSYESGSKTYWESVTRQSNRETFFDLF